MNFLLNTQNVQIRLKWFFFILIIGMAVNLPVLYAQAPDNSGSQAGLSNNDNLQQYREKIKNIRKTIDEARKTRDTEHIRTAILQCDEVINPLLQMYMQARAEKNKKLESEAKAMLNQLFTLIDHLDQTNTFIIQTSQNANEVAMAKRYRSPILDLKHRQAKITNEIANKRIETETVKNKEEILEAVKHEKPASPVQ